MYIQEMGRMAAEPKGAADTARFVLANVFVPSPPHGTTGWPGRKGARCFATPAQHKKQKNNITQHNNSNQSRAAEEMLARNELK